MDSMSTDEEILKAAKNVLSTHWHVSQTCAMGLETGEAGNFSSSIGGGLCLS